MSRSVLLIDDDDDVREIARMSLELTAGHTVRDAPDGPSGLASAVAHRPDAILVDVMMPRMDGPTVVDHLRGDERTRSIPVVLLTARAQSGDVERFAALDVAGVITKPFDPMTLADEVARLLDWS